MDKINYNWREKREKKAFLALADGTVMHGYSVGAPVDKVGEVVFNTGLSGYQEILSDPSYAGQFVTMTYPEIGSYGINGADMESRGVFLNGFLIHEYNEPSNWRSEESLGEFLKKHNVPCLAGIDTRALTTKLRREGTITGFLHCSGNPQLWAQLILRSARHFRTRLCHQSALSVFWSCIIRQVPEEPLRGMLSLYKAFHEF